MFLVWSDEAFDFEPLQEASYQKEMLDGNEHHSTTQQTRVWYTDVSGMWAVSGTQQRVRSLGPSPCEADRL